MWTSNSFFRVLVLVAAMVCPAPVSAQGTSSQDSASASGESARGASAGDAVADELPGSPSDDQFEAFVEAIREYFGLTSHDERHEAFTYGLDVHLAAMTYLAMNVMSQPEDVLTDDCTNGYVVGDQSVDAPETEFRSCRIVWRSGLDFVVEVVTADGEIISAPPDPSGYPYH